MKKFLALLIAALMSVAALAGCGGSDEKPADDAAQTETAEEAAEEKADDKAEEKAEEKADDKAEEKTEEKKAE